MMDTFGQRKPPGSSRRLPSIRSGTVLVWIEDRDIRYSNDSSQILERISNLNNCFIVRYATIGKAIQYIKRARPYERIVVVLLMQEVKETSVKRLNSYTQIRSILIVSPEKESLVNSLHCTSERIEIFQNDGFMWNRLEQILNETQLHDGGLFRMANRQEKSLRDIYQELGSYVWSQAFKVLVNAMPYNSLEAKEQMIHECRTSYRGNASVLNQIENFRRTYCAMEAIRWYTRDSFLYRMINAALRTGDIHALYTYRFFIIDMSARLEELKRSMIINHPTPFRVYRGSKLHREEVENLRVGALVATRAFFSCTISLNIAQSFIGINPVTGHSESRGRHDPEQFVLFYIDVNLAEMPDIILADISQESISPDEHEVLFDLGTSFVVQTITFNEEQKVWHIELTLSTELSNINQQYVKYMQDRLRDYDATMFFGNCLSDMLGDYKGAMLFFLRLLRNRGIQEDFHPNILYHLARVYRCMGLYPKAVNYFRRALLLQRRRLPQSGYDYARTLSGLAILYLETNQTLRSLNMQTTAVHICRQFLAEDHEEMAIFYNRLANVCYQERQYERASSLLSVALTVLKKKGPIGYTGYATSLDLMGTVQWALGRREEAIQYLVQALDMRRSFLTYDHPLVARTCYTLASIYSESENDTFQALDYAVKALHIRRSKLSQHHPELQLSFKLVQELIMKDWMSLES